MNTLTVIAAILRFPLFLLMLLSSPILWLLFFAVDESPREASKTVKELLLFYLFGTKSLTERKVNNQ